MPRFVSLVVFVLFGALPASAQEKTQTPVSFYKQIRPIFQAHCQGCHQPAKAKGDYVMTTYERLVAAGASGKKAIVPHRAGQSYLVESIAVVDGKARMPEGKPPLDAGDVDLVKRWIDEGAVDDTPANARGKFDAEHPPTYTLPPIIPSLDYSPDGKLLAVAGFHEVLLVDSDTQQLAGRLVGLAERIQSVRFSPDGARLAVAGGLPGRMGEIQVWDVARKKLKLSVPLTFDTLFGLSWSSDGKHLSFGCTDNSVRAVDAETAEQVLFQGGHSDWVLDTFFTADNKHVVSASRDMSVKLTEVATQRLIDNVTSITPGALKGGVQALARHPRENVFVAGGSDGTARVYKVFRTTARKIGDDANLVSKLPAQAGRIFSVRFSADGQRIASASSVGGKGEIVVAGYGKEVKEQARIRVDTAGLYALAFHPNGQTLAAAGGDGQVRLYDAASGKPVGQFAPAPVQKFERAAENPRLTHVKDAKLSPEKLPAGRKIVGVEVKPAQVTLTNPYQYAQLLVTARLDNGHEFDATRLAAITSGAGTFVTSTGLVRPLAEGQGEIHVSAGGHSAKVAVKVTGMKAAYAADFLHDVNPVLGRLGCNQGTCHGANKGKNGFKLSLRGVDAEFDVRAFLDDHAGRRANVASPDDSLMLLKASAGVPHVGGQLTRPGEPYYELLRNWIARGAQLDLKTPRVAKIDIQPTNPIVQAVGDRQQFRVLATYADGYVKDVTREAFLEVGNIELASVDNTALVTALRRGEVPLLARYDGAYAATTMLVMGDRDGFVWKDVPAFNKIDELTAAKWKRMKIEPSEVCTDLEFLRRVHLDLTGLPPTAEAVRAYLADPTESRKKREAVVDQLIGSPDYVEHWTNKWADLLTVNRKYLGPEGAVAFREWIKQEISANTPHDQFARKILTASGSNKANPAASYFKVQRDPASAMETTTHLFLAIRFNCNKCHDHPFERWTQDQYYSTAAYFARVGLAADPSNGNKMVGATAVQKGKPLFEVVTDKKDGEVMHERTQQMAAPAFPYEAKHEASPAATRREELAAWITSPDNAYFAKSQANRIWGYLMGVGIIDPIDDIRAGNPPTNPELLDYLTREFVQSGFNVRHLHRLITTSRTYQLSVATNRWNQDDKTNYSHALPRRLPAETLYDALVRVTGTKVKQGRAATLPDSGVDLPGGFLATFGRPARESACECERVATMQMGPVMALVNGSTIAEAIADPANEIARLVSAHTDDRKVVDELFLRILNRPATAREIDTCLETLKSLDDDHAKLVAAMEARKAVVDRARAKLETEREAAMARARAELDAYQKIIAPKVAVREKARLEAIAKAQAALKDYESKLDAAQAEWEKKQDASVVWENAQPRKAVATKGATLSVRPDQSIVAGGKNDLNDYTLTYQPELRKITGLRLEAIRDDALPKQGPGRAKDGNFVLTEIQVFVQKDGSKEAPREISLINPTANFSQGGLDIRFAVDGDTSNRDRGWGVTSMTGTTHWATFDFKEPVTLQPKESIVVWLTHNYKLPMHNLGRFRISFASAEQPVGLSLADDYREILATPKEERSAAQKDTLASYFRKTDRGLQQRKKDLADAQKPIVPDPKQAELQANLAEASAPFAEDGQLAQLRADVAASTAQLANRRLTAAQDIAWALINSPAFLFNH